MRGIRASLSFLALPILLPVLALVLVWALLGSVMMYAALASMIAYLIGPLGRELVIPAAVLLLMESVSVGIWEVVAISLSVACVDVSLALFVVWNFPLVRRSKYLARITDRIENVFTKRLGGGPTRRGYALLAAYVAFPLQFSGGFIATIIGSLLGYDPRRMVFAVTVGSVIGSLTMGLLAYLVGRPTLDLLALGALQLAGILIVVGFIIAAVYLYHSHRRKKDED
ncbi:MAG: small multi-drug export protein [Candidatus Thermoplasmatota archaeon]|nr:small multi-drug export protein [Candidatus Thermoplasmatota archaeon]